MNAPARRPIDRFDPRPGELDYDRAQRLLVDPMLTGAIDAEIADVGDLPLGTVRLARADLRSSQPIAKALNRAREVATNVDHRGTLLGLIVVALDEYEREHASRDEDRGEA